MVTVRLPSALVMRPKFVELMLVLGLLHCGVFKKLIASARIVKVFPSLTRTALLKDISRPRLAGPLSAPMVEDRFPVVPGAGFWRTMFPAASTATKLVNRPGRVTSPPKFGMGADFEVRPFKYWTNPFPTSTFPRFAGSAPTRSMVFEARLLSV